MKTPLDNAYWIAGAPYSYEDEASYYDEAHRNHVVSQTFELSETVGAASLSVAVLGYARVFVNGSPIDGSELLGWWTNYSKLVYYHTVDVSALLVKGANKIEIELGNGFYNPSPLSLFGKYNLRERLDEVGTPRVACSICDAAGEVLVKTDDAWSVQEGPVLFNNVYLGETFDETWDISLAPAAPVTVYDDMRALEPAPVRPCVRAGAVSPVRIMKHQGTVVVDFGEVVAGFLNIKIDAKEGQRVELTYAETWRDGAPYAGTAVAGYAGMMTPRGVCPGGPGAPEPAEQHDSIICRGGANAFENRFCWHSFRYVSIEGAELEDISEATAVYVHTDLSPAGKLELADDRFKLLHEAAIRTKLNNNHGVFEDCARERFGYGGDMIALAVSQMFSFDVSGMLDKTIADFRRDQTNRGGLPETAPFMGIGSNAPAYREGPLLWQVAYPYLTLAADRVYGRRDLLEREWGSVERFGDYLLSFDPTELATHCLGDHGSIVSKDFKNGTPDKEFVGWCSILWGIELVKEAGGRLGCDVARFYVASSDLRRQIVDRFKHEDGTFAEGTQTSFAFAAQLELGDRAGLLAQLAAVVEAEGVLSTGVFGTTFAFELLSAYGHNEVLERWLIREDDPSLLNMLSNGNGALIEMFDDPLASCDHAMFSSYDQWFYEGLGGIRVDDDARGCDKMSIKPYLTSLMDDFSCAWETPQGEVRVAWHRRGVVTEVEVALPAGIEARIETPFGCEELSREERDGWIVMTVKEKEREQVLKYPHLFSPIKLGDVLVQNRIVANPMSERFEDRCQSGAGIVICGHTIVEPGRSSWMSSDEPYLFSKYQREEASRRARMARLSGSAASIELAHAGQYARTVDYAMGPDAFIREDGVEVKSMTPEMMKHTASCWAQACVDARHTGFDTVFLHFGHGWLMGQFLSPLFNHRTDEYGGSIENRMRFPLQVLRACREAAGPRFPMEMRISADEWIPGGISLGDVVEFCRAAQEYVTSIQVSCGLDIEHEANVHTSATNLDPHMLNIELSRAVRAAVDVPVTLVGSVETPDEAEAAIAEGACDMVALARALAADPLWPKKAREGRDVDIVPCLRCLQCYHISTDRWNVGCSVNPRYANEDFVPRVPEKAAVPKKVLVVGAGPAGCMAAITACERGHRVTLVERSQSIGGNVRLIARESHKEDAARYLCYLQHRISCLAESGKIELVLGCEVTPDIARGYDLDAMVIAVGARPFVPPVPGADHAGVLGFSQAIEHAEELGHRVVIVGGGTIGAELALELAESGREVKIVEMGGTVAAQGNSLFRIALRQMFDKQGDSLEVLLKTACLSIGDSKVIARGPKGDERVLPYDNVVFATGVRPRSDVAERLFGIAEQSFIVGDCRKARVIKDAVFEGYAAGAAI